MGTAEAVPIHNPAIKMKRVEPHVSKTMKRGPPNPSRAGMPAPHECGGNMRSLSVSRRRRWVVGTGARCAGISGRDDNGESRSRIAVQDLGKERIFFSCCPVSQAEVMHDEPANRVNPKS